MLFYIPVIIMRSKSFSDTVRPCHPVENRVALQWRHMSAIMSQTTWNSTGCLLMLTTKHLCIFYLWWSTGIPTVLCLKNPHVYNARTQWRQSTYGDYKHLVVVYVYIIISVSKSVLRYAFKNYTQYVDFMPYDNNDDPSFANIFRESYIIFGIYTVSIQVDRSSGVLVMIHNLVLMGLLATHYH